MAEDGKNVTVRQSGLVIDDAHPFLAASPDGIVTTPAGAMGLIEVKNVLKNKIIILFEAAKSSSFCLKLVNNKLYLKENHKYYFQSQGFLNICKIPWLDFIVRATNPHHIFIQRILRDQDLWLNVLVPKLREFILKCLLPHQEKASSQVSGNLDQLG